MLSNIIFLLIGFVLLVKGADVFVDGSSDVAKKLKIPSVIVGLTIVAMGTSLPELAVSLTSAIEGSNEIAISNVVGSNFFNLIAILGICTLICPVVVDKKIMKMDFPFSIVITVGLLLLSAEKTIFGKSGYGADESGVLGRIDGIILLLVFLAFMIYTVLEALKERKNFEEDKDANVHSTLMCLVFIVGGIVAIIFGGELVVSSSRAIALEMGMTETLIGLTIVAIGTSLPELVTSVVASKKGEAGLAVGNVIGSNIFNILFILGISAVISPMKVASEAFIDMALLIAVSIIAYVFSWSREKIDKKEGFIMLLIYAAYMVYAILR